MLLVETMAIDVCVFHAGCIKHLVRHVHSHRCRRGSVAAHDRRNSYRRLPCAKDSERPVYQVFW
jgi:hypothetical protein